MTETPKDRTLLDSLLRQQHSRSHTEFKRAYDRAAARIEPELVGTAPTRVPADVRIKPAVDSHRSPEPPDTVTPIRSVTVGLDRPAPAQPNTHADIPPAAGTTIHTNARMRALMSWVDQNSPLKEADIHPQREPDQYRSYSRGRGIERSQ
ncbi:hypothetical protein [Nocardia sp. NPDC005366]|uniref:hypothetical protein n=1 Tax=Nocardia sp. NPDC005366 TaxID=3156878 RepID=UPI0033A00604